MSESNCGANIRNASVTCRVSELPMELSENSDYNCMSLSFGSGDRGEDVSSKETLKRNAAVKQSECSRDSHPDTSQNESSPCPKKSVHQSLKDRSFKRELSSEMESNSDETSSKIVKLSDCDETLNDTNTSTLKMSNDNEDSCVGKSRETEDEATTSSFTVGCSETTINDVVSENLVSAGSSHSCESSNLDVKSVGRKVPIPKTFRYQTLLEGKASSSSLKSSKKGTNSCNSPCKMEETRASNFENDNNSEDTSSCDSTSSSGDFITMYSPSENEDEEENDTFGFEDEQNSETDDDNLPPVLQKTLPVEKFSFPKEFLLRQVNSGDSKRRHYFNFEKKVYGSRGMVQRLKLFNSLKKHNGCVNTLSFNDAGNILISASDDRHVSLWNWAENKNLLHFDSGHIANVFQAKFLPHSNERTLISCGLDNQVRKCLLDGCGLKSTTLLTKHEKAVHKIAMQPQMPNCFLTAGEDGVVYSIDIRENDKLCTKLLKVHGHRLNSMATMCLYSIHCNPVKNFEFIVGGRCETIRLYDQRNISSKRQNPVHEFRVGCDSSDQEEGTLATITCAVYNHNGTEILASYNDNDIFLFNSNEPSRYAFRYDGHRNITTIKGVNFFGPQSEFVVSGSDCGYIYIWDKKSESVVQWLKGDKDTVNCLEPHPSFPVLATSGLDNDVKVWMPTLPEGCKDIANKKEFQKIVKENLYYKRNNYFEMKRRLITFIFSSIVEEGEIEGAFL